MRMSKRALLISAGVIALVAIAFTGWFYGCSQPVPSPSPTASASASVSTAAQPTPTTVPTPVVKESATPTPQPQTTLSSEEIQAAANSLEQAPVQPDKVVAPESLELFGVDLSEVFPPGTKISVDQSTWTDVDATTAMVATTITRPGQSPQDYTAVLGKSQGQWKLLGTLPLETDTP